MAMSRSPACGASVVRLGKVCVVDAGDVVLERSVFPATVGVVGKATGAYRLRCDGERQVDVARCDAEGVPGVHGAGRVEGVRSEEVTAGRGVPEADVRDDLAVRADGPGRPVELTSGRDGARRCGR